MKLERFGGSISGPDRTGGFCGRRALRATDDCSAPRSGHKAKGPPLFFVGGAVGLDRR